MKGMKKGEWYINNNCEHSKNQIAYASKRKKSILYQVTNGLVHEKRKKLVEFATLFHTLKHGRPTYEYEVHKDLFDFLNFENSPKIIRHTILLGLWLNISMALFWRQQNLLLKKPKYLSLTCNEISTIDSQS